MQDNRVLYQIVHSKTNATCLKSFIAGPINFVYNRKPAGQTKYFNFVHSRTNELCLNSYIAGQTKWL